MLARFHVAEEVTRSPFGVQTRQNLDSSLAVSDVLAGTAEKIERPQSPSFLRLFVVPLLFPLAGFMLLWGVMKSIAWVATGFAASKGIQERAARAGLKPSPRPILKAGMRVFVLGAGASLHAGYPLAAQMGNFLAAWINTLPPEHQYRSCLEQIAELYGGLENFESILADLMTAAPGSRAASLGAARPYLLSDLKEALRDHFDSIRSAPAPLYDLLARVLRQGDVVITFNYDLGVERALRAAGLWDIRTGYGFSIEAAEQPSPVGVLKLHGSTNWRALLFGGRTGFFAGGGNSLGNRPVLFFRPDLEYLGYTDFVDPRCVRLDSAASLPAMIMPALPKTFHFATTYGQSGKSSGMPCGGGRSVPSRTLTNWP